MKENLNYISDTELEQLIFQVEQEELVAAPPDLLESVWEEVGRSKKKEFRAYCFRVITSVAAAIALVFLLPELSALAQRTDRIPELYWQDVPLYEKIVETVPMKEEVVAVKNTPSKEDVLNGAGFFDKVFHSDTWIGNDKGKK